MFSPSSSPLFLSVSPRGDRSLLRRLPMGKGRVIPIKTHDHDRARILKGSAESVRSFRPRVRPGRPCRPATTCDGGLWSLCGNESRPRTRRFVQRDRGEPIGPGAGYARHPRVAAFAVPKFPAPCPLLDLYSVTSSSTEVGEVRACGTRVSSYGEYTRLFSGRDRVREHEATLRLGKSAATRAKNSPPYSSRSWRVYSECGQLLESNASFAPSDLTSARASPWLHAAIPEQRGSAVKAAEQTSPCSSRHVDLLVPQALVL